jgi:hypothetical protein
MSEDNEEIAKAMYELNTTMLNIKNNIASQINSKTKNVLNSIADYQTQGTNIPSFLSNYSANNLITNAPILLDELYADDAMVTKMINLLVEAPYKTAPKIQTDLLSANDLNDLQLKFANIYFPEFRNAYKTALLYGGSYLVMNFYNDEMLKEGKTLQYNTNIDDIKQGDYFEISAHSPWQIINRKFLSLNGIGLNTQNKLDTQIKYLTQVFNVDDKNAQNLLTNEQNTKTQILEGNYMFSGMAGVQLLGKIIDDTRIIRIINGDGFLPDYIASRIVNRGMGLSILESVDEDLRRYQTAVQTILDLLKAPLVRNLTIDNLSMGDFNGQGAAKIRETIQHFKNFLETGVLISDGKTNYSQLQTSFNGVIEIVTFLKNAFIEKAGIPLNIWMGEGASGLNATGQDVEKQWQERILTEQNRSKMQVTEVVKHLAKSQYGVNLTDISIQYNNDIGNDEVKQKRKDGLIKNLIDTQTLFNGAISKAKLIQILNNGEVFDINLEAIDVNENIDSNLEQDNNKNQNFLNLVNADSE